MPLIVKQFFDFWVKLSRAKKVTFAFFLLIPSFLLAISYFKSFQLATPLFPQEVLTLADATYVRDFLEKKQIPFEEEGMCFFVDKKKVSTIRSQLSQQGIPRPISSEEGFELFDSNTWIKGERELQVLEMRAMKGQLERDLTEFEAIRSAKVLLDIPSPRPFGGDANLSKASVILHLKPKAHMTSSQLQAISSHLSGAVRGLTPDRIAISDTKGRLYQSIGSPVLQNKPREQEEQIREKLEELLDQIVGPHHYYLSLQMALKEEQISGLSALVLLDEENLSLSSEIGKHALTLLQAFWKDAIVSIDRLPSQKQNSSPSPSIPYVPLFVTSIFFLGALATIFFLLRKKKKQEASSSLLFETEVDFQKLALSLKSQSPQTIALLFSHLQPAKARLILKALPQELQSEVVSLLEGTERKEKDNG